MEKNQLLILEYYGLELLFDKSDYEPVRIYGKRKDNLSSAKIVFEDGLFSSILVQDVLNVEKLSEDDELLFCKIIETYLSEIISAWLSVFIYDRKIRSEIIQKKLN